MFISSSAMPSLLQTTLSCPKLTWQKGSKPIQQGSFLLVVNAALIGRDTPVRRRRSIGLKGTLGGSLLTFIYIENLFSQMNICKGGIHLTVSGMLKCNWQHGPQNGVSTEGVLDVMKRGNALPRRQASYSRNTTTCCCCWKPLDNSVMIFSDVATFLLA